MAKDVKQCELCRRAGEKLFLKGERCYSAKCGIVRRAYAPGEHGISGTRKKVSEYGTQLREKQKVKRTYWIREAQFANYYKKADSSQGVTGEELLKMLEMRFDNIVYRLNFVPSRKTARQLIDHGHFTINGKKVNIPSVQLKPGDKIEVKKSSHSSPFFGRAKAEKNKTEVEWLLSDIQALKGEVKRYPERAELDPNINEQLIVELYSK